MLIIERTPFEKGASLKLSPENFRFVFSQMGRPCIMQGFFILGTPYLRKNQIKVFGKWYGGEPFLRKGSPINNYKLLYMYCGYETLFRYGVVYAKAHELTEIRLSTAENIFCATYGLFIV